jgi:hypothetical protein
VFELRDAIKTLDASNNRIAVLPPTLAQLTNLQRLVRRVARSARVSCRCGCRCGCHLRCRRRC